jgi:protein phosphatase
MIRDTASAYPFAALTDAGLVRETNEDRYAISAFHTGEETPEPGILAVVSDGVGGETGGEVAAALAVDGILRHVYAAALDDATQALPEAIRAANAGILEEVSQHPGLKGMAATVACAWISGLTLHIATLGDSRIYLLRNPDQILQLSTDHTTALAIDDLEAQNPPEAEIQTRSHEIHRYLGSDTPPNVDMHIRLPNGSDVDELRLLPGDIIFICTDGCTDLVSESEIRAMFSGQKLEKSLEGIKQLAMDRGGRDNITMLAVQVPVRLAPIHRRGRAIGWILAILAVLLAIALGLYLGWYNQTNPPGATPTAALTPQQFFTLFSPTFLPRTPLSGLERDQTSPSVDSCADWILSQL